jgi:GGDEF domain-containing protein
MGSFDEVYRRIASFSSMAERLQDAAQRAATDALTGLPGRAFAEAAISQRLASAEPTALILVDLLHLKSLNRRCGPQAGDDLIRTVSIRLTEVARPCDTICRWDGDKFLIISDGDVAAAGAQADRLNDLTARVWVAELLPEDTLDAVVNRLASLKRQHKRDHSASSGSGTESGGG